MTEAGPLLGSQWASTYEKFNSVSATDKILQSARLATSPIPQTSKISFGLVSYCKTLFGPIRKMSEYWSSD